MTHSPATPDVVADQAATEDPHMTAFATLSRAITACEADPHGGKVMLDLDTARALMEGLTAREGDTISRAAAIAAIELKATEAVFRDAGGCHRAWLEALRALPPQDGDRELAAELATLKRTYNQLFDACAAEQARAEKAEARAVELEAENERIGDLFDDLCHFTTPEQRRAYLTGGAAALTAQPVAQDEDSPARIWLEPICAYDALGGRTWSDTRQERCDDCNLDPVEYIRADLAPVAIALGVSVQSVGPLSVNIFGARQAKCATEGCTERAIDHIVAGDVGSDFCVTCSDKIQASSAAPVGGR